jgi:uncharacterized protein YndB with AHSA1/START domain
MNTLQSPVVTSAMLIRKPVSDVFEAMVNPDITSRFWFTRGSGRVEAGKTLVWEWGQFGVNDTVDILEVIENEFISLHWALGEIKTTVEIKFESKSDNSTLVNVFEKGFWKESPSESENLEEVLNMMLGQKGGWTLVLASMKAWLEHELDLKLIADHKPE